VFFTGLAVMLSSLTNRALYAGVAIFAVTLSVGIGALLVAAITGNPYVPYASPITNILSVASAVFGVSGTPPTNPAASAVVLAGAGIFFLLVAALRLSRVEVVGE
jgi:hypothetical protein